MEGGVAGSLSAWRAPHTGPSLGFRSLGLTLSPREVGPARLRHEWWPKLDISDFGSGRGKPCAPSVGGRLVGAELLDCRRGKRSIDDPLDGDRLILDQLAFLEELQIVAHPARIHAAVRVPGGRRDRAVDLGILDDGVFGQSGN